MRGRRSAAERPRYWRYWRDLPPRGSIGLFLSAWYNSPLLDRVYGETTDAELEEQLDEIVTLEKMLAADGYLIAKFWMHLGREAQRERCTELFRAGRSPPRSRPLKGCC